MHILITAATIMELQPIQLKLEHDALLQRIHVDYAATGIGQAATAYHMARLLKKHNYNWCLNVGIAGSFNPCLGKGSVVVVGEDCFADLGVEDAQGFHSLFDVGLADRNETPYTNGWLRCPYVDHAWLPENINAVRAITVNTASGCSERISDIVNRYNPSIESMEGAAFFYACLLEGVPFIQIRAISNMVEPRDKSKWNIPLALTELAKAVCSMMHNMLCENEGIGTDER